MKMMSYLVKEEPNDALDAIRVKTESNGTDAPAVPSTSAENGTRFRTREDCSDSSVESGEAFDEEKQPKAAENETDVSSEDCEFFDEEKKSKGRKRKADSSPEQHHPRLNIKPHKCLLNKIARKSMHENRPDALKDSRFSNNSPPPGTKPEILLDEFASKDTEFIDKIIEFTKLNQILKLPLPPNTSKPGSEIVEFTYTSEGSEWKNDVNNPAINAVDWNRSVERIVNFLLVKQSRCKKDLERILSYLNNAVKYPGFMNRWEWFGSYLTGLACFDSDINLHYECVRINKWYKNGKIPVNLPEEIAEFIKTHERFQGCIFNPCVRFPWVKTLCKIPKRQIEITFSTDLNSSEMLVAKSLLMKFYLDMSLNLSYLTLLVKIILQKHGIHGPGTKFQTYTIFWLVVFFMQLKKLLPAVIDVRKAAKIKHYVAGWDCSLPENYLYWTEPVSSYVLLLEFFDFYKNFDFLNYVICPYLGRVFRLSDFEQLRIPPGEFSLYLKQVNNPRQLTFVRNVINLQDPSDLCCNVAQSIEPEIAGKFNTVCHYLRERLVNPFECLCKLLAYNKNDYTPYKFTDYSVLVLRTIEDLNFSENRLKKLNQMYILEAIRKIMELMFKFEKKSIVTFQNFTQAVNKASDDTTVIKQTFPVIYFEYCSSEDTWKNDYIKEIIPRKEDAEEQIKMFLTCEVCLEKNFVKIFVQAEVNFVKFLRKHLLKLLRFTLEEIVPDVVR